MKDKQRRMRPGLLIGLALLLAVAALILAGCGGGGSSSSSSESGTTASSSGSGSESSSSGSSESETNKGGMFNISSEARACLKEKGVELPEFKGGGEGGEPPEGFEPPEGGEKPEGMPEGGPGGEGGEGSEKFEEQKEAFEECGVETGNFKGGPGGEGGKPSMNSAAFKKQVKEYAACVRENGYEIAEPNFSGEGPVFEKSESESAAFKKASKSCETLLKGSGGSGSEGESESGSEG